GGRASSERERARPAESGPARRRSVWADVFLSGWDGQMERERGEPEPAAHVPGAQVPGAQVPGAQVPGPEAGAGEPDDGGAGYHEPGYGGVPGWPASGLPPSFGQRSAEGERPAE